jgi:hypothetical protein
VIEGFAAFLVRYPDLEVTLTVLGPDSRDHHKAVDRATYQAQRVVYALENHGVREGQLTARGTTVGFGGKPKVSVHYDLETAIRMGAEPGPLPDHQAVEVVEIVTELQDNSGVSTEGDFCTALSSAIAAAPENFRPIDTSASGGSGPSVHLPGAAECKFSGMWPLAGMKWTYFCSFDETTDPSQADARFDELRGEVASCLPWTWASTDELAGGERRFFMAAGEVGERTVGVTVSLREISEAGDPYVPRVWVEVLE